MKREMFPKDNVLKLTNVNFSKFFFFIFGIQHMGAFGERLPALNKIGYVVCKTLRMVHQFLCQICELTHHTWDQYLLKCMCVTNLIKLS